MDINPAVACKIEEISAATRRGQLRISFHIACTINYLLWGTNCAEQETVSVEGVFIYDRRIITFFEKDTLLKIISHTLNKTCLSVVCFLALAS